MYWKVKEWEKNSQIQEDVWRYIESEKDKSKILDNIEYTPKEDLTEEQKQYILDLQEFVIRRKEDMVAHKTVFETEIELSDAQYESETEIFNDWSAYFNLPLEKMIMNVMESELWDRDIEYNIKPTWTVWNINKIKANKVIMDYLYRKDKTSKKAKLFRKNFLKYWFTVLFEWLKSSRKTKRTDNEKYDWNFLKWEVWVNSEIVTEYQLWSRVVPTKNFYFDDKVVDFDDAVDCVEIEQLWYNDIIARFSWKQFFNLDKVMPSIADVDNEITHYYNKEIDLYVILLTDVIIYAWPNPFPHKKLPFSVAVMYESDSYWYWEGWVCKVIRFAKPYLNDMLNIALSQTKNSNQPPLLLWEEADFDWYEPSYWTWNIWKFSWSLNEVRELKTSSPDSSIFKLIEIVLDFVTQSIWVDIKSIYWQVTRTKFEAWLQEQSKNKRISHFWKILDHWYETFLQLRLLNSHFFLPKIEVETINEDASTIKKSNSYTTIVLDWIDIKTLWDWSKEFIEEKWAYSEFELNPKDFKWTYQVNVITEETRPILKEIEKEDAEIIVNQIAKIREIYPEAELWVNPKDLLVMVLNTFWKDPDDLIPMNRSKVIKESIDKLRAALLWMPKEDLWNPKKTDLNKRLDPLSEEWIEEEINSTIDKQQEKVSWNNNIL